MWAHFWSCQFQCLAQKIFNEQERLNFPGLIKECEDIAHEMNIQTELKTMDRKIFKKFINEKMIKYNEKILKEEIKSKEYKKIKTFLNEQCELKDYFKILNVEEVRLKFRMRTKMIDAKLNFKNRKDYSHELWLCDSCESAIESQSHLLWCPAYQNLREGKSINNDKDLIQYIKKVLEIRQDLKLRR